MIRYKNTGNLDRIKKELEHRRISMRYSKPTTDGYLRIFGWVEHYLIAHEENNYSPEWGAQFVANYMLLDYPDTMYKQTRTLVRQFDEILENKPFVPRFLETKTECPPNFTHYLKRAWT